MAKKIDRQIKTMEKQRELLPETLKRLNRVYKVLIMLSIAVILVSAIVVYQREIEVNGYYTYWIIILPFTLYMTKRVHIKKVNGRKIIFLEE
jgi:hypothetical protein